MRFTDNLTTAFLRYGLIFIVYIIFSFTEEANAQKKNWELSKLQYTGIEASFGAKLTKIKSDVPELSGMTLIEEGGSAGFIYGNSFSRLVVRPVSFYTAASSIGRTINLFSMEVENNTYLLKGLFGKPVRFDIYSLLGINFSSYKFFGHYINKDLRPEYGNKAGKEPYLGKMENLMISAGLGMEYRLLNDSDFIHIFLSGKQQFPMEITTHSKAFEKTEFEKNFDISLGLRFGMVSSNKKVFRRL